MIAIRTTVPLLLLSQDSKIAKMLKSGLTPMVYRIERGTSSEDARRTIEENNGEVVYIIDTGLFKADWPSFCEMIRKQTLAPMLVLLENSGDSEIDVCVALEAGADSVRLKEGFDFTAGRLSATIQALVRRCFEYNQRTSNHRKLRVGSITMDLEAHLVWVGKREVNLGSKEWEILRVLMYLEGRVATRELLQEQVWAGYPAETRTMAVHISRLRSKLANADIEIKTVNGLGYVLVRS